MISKANDPDRNEALKNFTIGRDAISGLNKLGEKVGPSWFDEDVVSFAHGEGMRRPHASVVAAGVSALLDSENRSLDNYLYMQEDHALNTKIVKSFLDMGVPSKMASNTLIDCGVTRVFLDFFYAVAKPGDTFLIPRSYYQGISMWCDIAGVNLESVETLAENDYRLTAEDIQEWYSHPANAKSRERVVGVILINPGYAGCVYTDKDLESLAEEINNRGLYILEDAIFSGTEFPGNRTRYLASVPSLHDRLVLVDGASKKYGLANMRIAWACGPNAIIEKMKYHASVTSLTVPAVSRSMAAAALEAPKNYLSVNARECMTRVNLIVKLLDDINNSAEEYFGARLSRRLFTVPSVPAASHSLLVSANGLRGLKLPDGTRICDSADVTRYFLQEAKICLSPAISNGFSDCTVRFSYACVGVESTYSFSTAKEIEAAQEVITDLQGMNPTAKGIMHPRGGNDDIDHMDFSKGRRMIEESIVGGLKPAVLRLLAFNQKNSDVE